MSAADEFIDDACDDDEWLDLEPTLRPGALAPLATVRLTQNMGIKTDKPKPARALIWLRRELAEWAVANGPRFRLQIGGDDANRLRILPDASRGKYEIGDFKGVKRLNLGIVNLWPDENRPPVEAQHKISTAGLVLTLPADFARPSHGSALAVAALPPPVAPARLPAPMAALPARIAADSAEMRLALGVTDTFPQEIGGVHFAPQEAAIIEALLKRAKIGRDGLLLATHDPARGEDERQAKTVDVLVSKMRGRLAQLGVAIGNSGGMFSLDLGDKATLRALVGKARETA